MRSYAYFNELPISTLFSINGAICKKQSTKTHDLNHASHTRRFYAAKHALCVIGQYSRLSSDYFEATP